MKTEEIYRSIDYNVAKRSKIRLNLDYNLDLIKNKGEIMKRKNIILLSAIAVAFLFIVGCQGNVAGEAVRVKNVEKQALAKTTTPPLINLHSDFFKNNDVAINIALTGQPYDLNKEKLQITNDEGYSEYVLESFSYKLLNGFIMLGYFYATSDSETQRNQHKGLLHLFQEDYGFEKSDIFTKAMLLKMDQLLSKREIIYKQHAKNWPLFKRIDSLHPNDVSKEYIAGIYELSNSVLPSKIQLKTEEDWFKYLKRQGFFVGHVHLSQVNPFLKGDHEKITSLDDNWVFTDNVYNSYIQPNSNYLGASKSSKLRYHSSIRMFVFLHELAHYFEREYPPSSSSPGIDYSQKIRVDTRGFHNISFIVDSDLPIDTFEWPECPLFREETTAYDFISSYSINKVECANVSFGFEGEGFADMFADYVMEGEEFRAAAQINSKIAQKYNWLKENLFDGREYLTNTNSDKGSGCKDYVHSYNKGLILNGHPYDGNAPGYLTCEDENNVWDGTLKWTQKKLIKSIAKD